jgi:hypothetical protein
VRRRLPVGRAARRDRPPPRRHEAGLHRRAHGVIDDIASRLDPTDVEAARQGALTVFGLMVGTLQLGRALTDRDLSDQLLAGGVETALKVLDERA